MGSVLVTGQVWAGLAAAAAALFYAGGAILQQRATAAPVATGPGSGWRSLAALPAHPLWLAGVTLDGAAFLLEFTALRAGSLTLVQPLLVSGLLFALPLGAALARRRIQGRELVAAALVCAGLSVALCQVPGLMEGIKPRR